MNRVYVFLAVVVMAGPAMAGTTYQFHDLGWIGQANAISNGVPAGYQQGAGLQPVISSGGVVTALPTGGYSNDMINTASNGQYGGSGQSNGIPVALYWPTASSSPINLNPTGYDYSRVLGMDATQQVGAASLTGPYFSDHALLWSGSASSVVDLNPSNVVNAASIATGTYDGYQVGTLWSGMQPPQAVLWHGTADSWTSLTPAGFLESYGTGIYGNHEVGYAWKVINGQNTMRAILWSGTAASALDITPAGYQGAMPTGICGNSIAGYGYSPGSSLSHALVWTGLGGNLIDLQAVTPAPYGLSCASGVDEAGNVVGYVGQADSSGSYTYYAALWSLQTVNPEPATLWLLAIAAVRAIGRKGLR